MSLQSMLFVLVPWLGPSSVLRNVHITPKNYFFRDNDISVKQRKKCLLVNLALNRGHTVHPQDHLLISEMILDQTKVTSSRGFSMVSLGEVWELEHLAHLNPVVEHYWNERDAMYKTIQNLMKDAFLLTTDDVMSSPLFKWAHIQLDNFSVGSANDSALKGEGAKRNLLNVGALWNQAINHSLRARQILCSTVTLCGIQNPGFHNLNLSSPTWLACLDAFQIKYSYLWLLGLATPFMKYHTASLFCKIMKQKEYPSKPTFIPSLFNNSGCFLTGIGACFLNFNVRNPNPRVASTFLHLKKGLPPVHPGELLSGVADWYKNLTKDIPIPDVSLDEDGRSEVRCPNTLEGFEALNKAQQRMVLSIQVQRTTRELFVKENSKKLKLLQKIDWDLPIPSQSSHYHYNKFWGGAFTKLSSELYGVRNSVKYQYYDKKVRSLQSKVGASYVSVTREQESTDDDHLPPIIKQILGQKKMNHNGSYVCTECSEYMMGLNIACSKWTNCISPCEMFEQCEQPVDDSLTDYLSYILRNWKNDKDANCVTPVALPEPLKVRLISRGPEHRYWLGKPLQKWMHSTIRDHPTFRAIGRPLLPEDIDDMGVCRSGEVYLSGDYKAATDLIDPYLSRACCRELSRCGKLGEFFSSILEDGLVGATLKACTYDFEPLILHRDSYPSFIPPNLQNGYGAVFTKDSPLCDSTSTGKQTWGQLMGSPLSFPILCIINAAVNRYFYEMAMETKYNREMKQSLLEALPNGEYSDLVSERVGTLKIQEVPMLINGDDVLLRIPKEFYENWKNVTLCAGLVPSIGKNYVSDRFVIINSTLYLQHDTFTGLSNFSEEPYFNMGLLHPTAEGKLDTDMMSLDPNVWDLGAISQKLVKNQSFELRDRMMSIFVGDPCVKGLLTPIPRGISWYASKTLGGCGLYASRRDLLTPEQLGYYTRLATECSELAPTISRMSCTGRSLENIYDRVRSEPISEDWNLTLQYGGPTLGNLWDAFLEKDPTWICVNNSLKESFRLSKLKEIDGDSLRERRSYMANIVTPGPTGLLRSHRHPWSENLLCNFPWSKQTLSVFEQAKISCNVGSFSEMDFDHLPNEHQNLEMPDRFVHQSVD